jgi:hypothetical protein
MQEPAAGTVSSRVQRKRARSALAGCSLGSWFISRGRGRRRTCSNLWPQKPVSLYVQGQRSGAKHGHVVRHWICHGAETKTEGPVSTPAARAHLPAVPEQGIVDWIRAVKEAFVWGGGRCW